MALPKSLGELGLNTIGEAVAFAAGFASGRALEPIAVAIAQEAWTVAPIRAPDAQVLAEGVAQGQVDSGDAFKWASEHGYGGKQFQALIDIANTGPALGLAYQAWRRGKLTPAQFKTALRRTGLEVEWDAVLEALKDERLDMGAVATAVHRGIMAGQGLIIREPPQTPGKIPHVEQSQLDAATEAEAHGFDAERLRILVGNTGLPPGLMEMLRLLNLGEATEDDVRRAIAQSNLRNEYMDVALALRRQLLTPHEYVENHLRGWSDAGKMHSGAALHGMEAADVDILFQNAGRPIAVHQITTGEARGGTYGGDYAGVPEPYNKALRESNVRPEWGNLAYANRYTYPGAFVIRALAQGGDLTEAETHQILLDIGWEPGLAAKVSKRWHAGTTAKADPHVAKADTHLWTALHKSYVSEESDEAAITPGLHALGVADIATVLSRWNAERALIHAQLTPAQIKKAHKNLPDKWPRQRALDALLARGYTEDEAATLLDE